MMPCSRVAYSSPMTWPTHQHHGPCVCIPALLDAHGPDDISVPGGAGMRMSSFLSSSVSALSGRPPALRACASVAWARRWWGMLSVAVQHAIGGTALGEPWLLPRALSMVLTARSTAHCCGHKLVFGGKRM